MRYLSRSARILVCADSCRLFTAAPSKRGNAPYHAAILHKRTMAGVSPDNLLDPYGGKCPEPTIFFELGCRATTSSSRRAEHHTHTHQSRTDGLAQGDLRRLSAN